LDEPVPVDQIDIRESWSAKWQEAAYLAHQGGVVQVFHVGQPMAAVVPWEVARDWLSAREDLQAAEETIRRLGQGARAFRGEGGWPGELVIPASVAREAGRHEPAQGGGPGVSLVQGDGLDPEVRAAAAGPWGGGS